MVEAKDAKVRVLSLEMRGLFTRLGKIEAIGAVEVCGNELFRWRCPNGHFELMRSGCGSPLCWFCVARRRLGLIDDLWGVIKKFYGDDNIQASQFVFSLPYEAAALIDESMCPAIQSKCNSLVEDELGGVMISSVGGKQKKRRRVVAAGIGACHVFHSYHSYTPGNVWRGWYPHFNVLVFDKQFDNMAIGFSVDGSVGGFVHRKVSLSLDEANNMRVRLAKRWKSYIEKLTGRKYDLKSVVGPKGYESTWDVNYSYAKTTSDSERMLYYVMRPSLYDVFMEVTRGRAPTDSELVWADRLLTKQPDKKSYVNFGWLADCVRSKYEAKVGVPHRSAKERRQERSKKRCLVCGEEMVRDGTVYNWSQALESGIPIRGYRPEGGG